MEFRDMWRPAVVPPAELSHCIISFENGALKMAVFKDGLFRKEGDDDTVYTAAKWWVLNPMTFSPAPQNDLPIEVMFHHLLNDYKRLQARLRAEEEEYEERITKLEYDLDKARKGLANAQDSSGTSAHYKCLANNYAQFIHSMGIRIMNFERGHKADNLQTQNTQDNENDF